MKYVDIHSHILPYMDDGSQDMKMTLKMLQVAWEEGITDIIVTPHYRSGYFKADRKQMKKLLEEVRSLAGENGILMNLYPGNEIYYRSELDEKLDSGELSTMNGTEYVLEEFSPMEDYLYIRNAVEDIFSMGYSPILAHVERYQCLYKNSEYVSELKSMGCDIQVNASSVTGEIGLTSKHFVHKLLKEKLVDYVGTDAHNAKERRPAIEKCAELLYKKYDKAYVDAVLSKNAADRLLNV